MKFEDMKNPELQEKLKACESAAEIVKLAQEEGVELTDEQLEAVSGGACDWEMSKCPNKQCRSVNR